MVDKMCEACGKGFSYEPNNKYKDNRKYCDECGSRKKAEYEARQKLKETGMQNNNEQKIPNEHQRKEKTEIPKIATTSDEIRAAVAVKCAVELHCTGKYVEDIEVTSEELYKILKKLARS